MRVRSTLDELLTQTLGAPAVVRVAAKPEFGHYQANGVMGEAKKRKTNPRELAQTLVADAPAEVQSMCASLEVAGPGFVNLKLSDEFLLGQLGAIAADARRGTVETEAKRTVVVDYSSPNVAKPLHVGHLRSTILGDAIVRVLRFLGHNVVGDNHVGDWGTQFGMLIVGFRKWGDRDALAAHATDELERVYRLANDAAKEDGQITEEARAELAKLQAGDPDNRALWDEFIAASQSETQKIYNRLNVALGTEEWRGESTYHDRLGPLVDKLLADGVAREDEGAVLIYFDDDKQLADKPFMIRKSDGAFNYATTDLATIAFRLQTWNADEMVYVVDKRQSLHFRQLFAAAAAVGWSCVFKHISFGAILGPDGRPIKTREGGTVRLADLLAEAVERARKIIEEKNPDLSPDEREQVAEMVGVGAVKYADLSQNRNSDYRFDWEKLLAFDGNTAPYLQYVHARIHSIFRKMDLPFDAASWDADDLGAFEHDSERALALMQVRLADVLDDVVEDYYPNMLTDHLFNLAQAFNAFYRDCPVQSSTGATRNRRLSLCLNTAEQIRLGLDLLGIQAPKRM